MPSFSSFHIFSVLFPITFILIFAGIVFIVIRGIREWSRNNASPRVPVHAHIVAKRQNIDTHMQNTEDSMMQTHTSTTYYITFEFDSGDRFEFTVSSREYGVLAEGDEGTLTFQGTRYVSFERQQL